VRPFPNVEGGRWQVSEGGGIQPVWGHSGRELSYVDPGTRELRVVQFSATTATFRAGPVSTLVALPFGFAIGEIFDFYDVAPGDERFVFARRVVSDPAGASFVLVKNFFEELDDLPPG
jgi:hypothetical protein